MERPEITVHHKIWFNIEIDGESVPFLGEQKISLLKEIHSTGSIVEAAKNMDIDYKKAWDMIESSNEKIRPYELVTSKKGRSGGTELTPFALLIIEEYDRINSSVEKRIDILNPMI
jgi:molybdate transport system regulatory protein